MRRENLVAQLQAPIELASIHCRPRRADQTPPVGWVPIHHRLQRVVAERPPKIDAARQQQVAIERPPPDQHPGVMVRLVGVLGLVQQVEQHPPRVIVVGSRADRPTQQIDRPEHPADVQVGDDSAVDQRDVLVVL